MRVKFAKGLELDRLEVRNLLDFGARGCGSDGVEVHLHPGREKSASGSCTTSWYVGTCARKTRCLITMKLPPSLDLQWPERHWNCYRLKRLEAKWPGGFPFMSWRDVLVWLAAHEFRHWWQIRRRRRASRRGEVPAAKLEYDAELFGLRRLNEYRVATGRDPIPEVKQPNPFARQGAAGPAAAAAASWARVEAMLGASPRQG